MYDWVFVSFEFQIKLITNVNSNKKDIYIVTLLGKDELLKPTKNIIIL